jgi:chromosome segregation ATPase
MQGDITVNGKKMTVTELVEAYCELKEQNNQLEFKLKEAEREVQDHKRVVNNIKENYKYLSTRCMDGADVALSEHRFGCLTICLNSEYEKLRNTIDELETELRVKDDLLTIKNAISNEPTEEHSSRPSIEWYECEMMKGLEEISRQKAIINNLVETLYLLKME